MTTTGSNTSGSGHVRGRGLDALFDGNQPSAPPAADIDAELAAMLDEEVRAGAPPIESLSAIPTAKEYDLLAAPPMVTARGVSAAQDEYGLAGGAPPAASWGRRGVLPGLASAPAAAAEETIDMPLPVADAALGGTAPAPVVRPELPAPVAPVVEAVVPAPNVPLPVTPAPVAPGAGSTTSPAGPAPVGGERPGQPPIRIGAVIIDSTPPPDRPRPNPRSPSVRPAN